MLFIKLILGLIGASLSRGVEYSTGTDYRRTVIKAGYGVNFDRVGHVLVDGGTSLYTHTWAITWPKIRTAAIPSFDCSKATSWARRCAALNTVIMESNTFVYESLLKATLSLKDAHDMIPLHAVQERRRRRRRNAPTMPSWLSEQDSDNILDNVLPTHSIGQMWADLTHTPGPRAIRKLKHHLRLLGSAIYENVQGIKNFESGISSLSLLTSKRIDLLRQVGTATDMRLEQLRHRIRNTYKKSGMEETRLLHRLEYDEQIDITFDQEVEPLISDFYRAVDNAFITAQTWTDGVRRLTQGFLPPTLVSIENVQELLDHITSNLLLQPRYADLHLPSASPLYYYKLKKIAYTRTVNDTLLISLSIPLYRIGGLLPVYRVDTYPVPAHAGMVGGGGDYTLVHGLPGFIAVSDNQEIYVEMSDNFFLSCSGDPATRTCGPGMPALKRKAGVTTCAFAIFIEAKTQVLEKCDFRYAIDLKPYGSAVQLSADSSFLVHASRRTSANDVWHLSCRESHGRPQAVLQPCNMCRIRIPCFCSMAGVDFFLPIRHTGCDVGTSSSAPPTTYLYHLNQIVMTELFPKSELAKLASYHANVIKMYPAFPIPNIHFTVADNFTDFVDVSNSFAAQFQKTIKMSKTHLKIYNNKAQAGLARARNFTDQVVDRGSDFTKAIDDLFNGVFGGKIGNIIAAIFGPLGLVCIAFVLASFEFIPNVTTAMYRGCKQRTIGKAYSLLHIKGAVYYLDNTYSELEQKDESSEDEL